MSADNLLTVLRPCLAWNEVGIGIGVAAGVLDKHIARTQGQAQFPEYGEFVVATVKTTVALQHVLPPGVGDEGGRCVAGTMRLPDAFIVLSTSSASRKRILLFV